MKNIDELKTVEELREYLESVESLTVDQWIKLTDITASIVNLDRENMYNKITELQSKTE